MAHFVYSIELFPLPDGPHAGEFSGAESNIWIAADSLEESRVLVAAALNKLGWHIVTVRAELRSELALHPRNQKKEADSALLRMSVETAYNQLIQTGIGIEVFAVRKRPTGQADLHISLPERKP